MPRSLWLLLLLASMVIIATGCGGAGQNLASAPTPTPTPTPTSAPSTTVTVTFTGSTPLAVATQVGNGAFTSVTPGDAVTLTLPSGAKSFAIAYLCPSNSEFVVESTIQDGTSLTQNCFVSPTTGTLTGNLSSSISGTTQLEVRGSQGGTILSSASGSFSASLAVGQSDVVVLAQDFAEDSNLPDVLGVKILRSQTVPGAISDSGITLTAPDDAASTQSFTMTNIPAAFSSPSGLVTYYTANGTVFTVSNAPSPPANPTIYAIVPAASTQAGDLYQYYSSIFDLATDQQLIGVGMTTTSGGGAVSLAYPAPWVFSGPTPAQLPTFTYNYSGFNGLPTTEYWAVIGWPGSAPTSEILVTATANFQNGANTITIPDLSALPGFLALAPSGTTVAWFAIIFGGNLQVVNANPQVVTGQINPPANASGAFVQNTGQFTQP